MPSSQANDRKDNRSHGKIFLCYLRMEFGLTSKGINDLEIISTEADHSTQWEWGGLCRAVLYNWWNPLSLWEYIRDTLPVVNMNCFTNL